MTQAPQVGWAKPRQTDLGRTVVYHFFSRGVSICPRHYRIEGKPLLVADEEMRHHTLTRKRCKACDTKLQKLAGSNY